jgi:hypothetical protein
MLATHSRTARAYRRVVVPRRAALRPYHKCSVGIYSLSPWSRQREHAPARLKLLILRVVSEHSGPGDGQRATRLTLPDQAAVSEVVLPEFLEEPH